MILFNEKLDGQIRGVLAIAAGYLLAVGVPAVQVDALKESATAVVVSVASGATALAWSWLSKKLKFPVL